ncbi:ferredoxin reductase family protein [Herbidospora cretacea]|uniref:ferredoxin reductase family protein n=1 Tax=Herbidospora cretacea TaxID=28444 RepID=UPI0009ED5CC8|nr:ferric reductase-like transmembrane domain-containing protein [Herbidospora cretacea]
MTTHWESLLRPPADAKWESLLDGDGPSTGTLHPVPADRAPFTAASRSSRPSRHRIGDADPKLAAPRFRPGGVVAGLLWAGALLATAACWIDLPEVASTTDGLAWLGRLTGLLAGYGAAILVALMARVPYLDRTIGADRLSRWHALGGRGILALSAAHMVFAMTAHALRSGVWEGTFGLVLYGPGILEATISLALLLGVGLISARAIRVRMSYETWHYAHFLTYLAIYLGFAHQLTGPSFSGGGAWAWRALYIAVAVLLIWHRFAVPVVRSRRHRLRVAGIRRESADVVSVYIAGENLAGLRAEPGQFFRWRFLTKGMWWAANPYSLSAVPDGRYLRITVKAAGSHSRALFSLTPGTRVWAEGPYGALTAARSRSDKILLIAGGVGISPLRALFESMPGRVTLLYLARTVEDLVLRNELDAIAAARGARIHYTVNEDLTVPLTGRSLSRAMPDLPDYDVFVCGPRGMTQKAMNALRRAGVPRQQIHLENFDF